MASRTANNVQELGRKFHLPLNHIYILYIWHSCNKHLLSTYLVSGCHNYMLWRFLTALRYPSSCFLPSLANSPHFLAMVLFPKLTSEEQITLLIS